MPARKPYRHYKNCTVCSKRVATWSRYCPPHQRRLRVYGHALGKPVRTPALVHYAVEARKVIDRNREHRGLQLALAEIDDLLNDALRRAAHDELLAPDFALWLGLAHKRITALDVMTLLCGALVYEQLAGDPSLNERAYHHRVARAVLSLGALKGRTSGGLPKDLGALGQRKLGRFLVERYSALGIGIVRAIEAAEQKGNERRALITVPLR